MEDAERLRKEEASKSRTLVLVSDRQGTGVQRYGTEEEISRFQRTEQFSKGLESLERLNDAVGGNPIALTGAAAATALGRTNEEVLAVAEGLASLVSLVEAGSTAIQSLRSHASTNDRNSGSASSRGGASVVRAGQVGESKVRRVEDIGPKVAIRVENRTRIPDGLTRDVLTEVKNVRTLSLTSQLRDFITHAKAHNLRFDLWVRPDVIMSGPLLDAIEDGSINRRFIP